MFSTGNYDEVYVLSERVMAIDYWNEEARGYINYIKKAEKNEEWRRLKDCKDIHSYIREYYAIYEEREEKKKKLEEDKLKARMERERKQDPAKYIL